MKEPTLEDIKAKCIESCDAVLSMIQGYERCDQKTSLYLKRTFLAIRTQILEMLRTTEDIS